MYFNKNDKIGLYTVAFPHKQGSYAETYRVKDSNGKTRFMKLINYFKESYNELVHKTSWPSRRELTSSAVVVLIASLLIALIVWLMDFGFENLMSLIYKYI